MNKSKRADIEEMSKIDLELIFACSAGYINLEMAKELVDKGARPDRIQLRSGMSAMHFIASVQNLQEASRIMEFFIQECECDPDIESENEETPLYIASRNDNEFMVDLLCRTDGVNVNFQNSLGESPLHGVFFNYNFKIAESLLKAGANPNVKDEEGITLLQEANEIGNQELIDLLEQYRYSNSDSTFIDLYNKDEAERVLDEINSDDSALIPHLETMVGQSSMRELAALDDEVFIRLESLRNRFPNFSEVIDYVVEQTSLAFLSKTPYFNMRPLLMTGAPGVGKTRFTKELSIALRLEFTAIDGGNTSSSATLGGSDSVWRDSKPGRVSDHLRKSENANPIILMDELEKMANGTGSDPYGPLYSLLEPDTAKTFMDQFYRVPFDCSYLNWFATTNSISSVPAPILDRFSVVSVPKPTKEQMPKIINSIYHDIVSSKANPWGDRFEKELSKEVVEELSKESPRKIKATILSTLGIVAKEIVVNGKSPKGKIKIQRSDISSKRIKSKSKVGF